MYYYDSKSDAIRRKNGSAIVLRNGVLRVGRCEECRQGYCRRVPEATVFKFLFRPSSYKYPFSLPFYMFL